jgi:spore coat polysaccharide biosynthesis protein SpsF
MKILAIIQARSGSIRLPNKALLHLHGYPMIQWIHLRLKACQKIDQRVFALPDNPIDDPLAHVLEDLGADVYRGNESDVLKRVTDAANLYQPSHVIRICADNPLVSPQCIEELIDFYTRSDYDYAYNHIPHNNRFPDGLGAEILSLELLQSLEKLANKPDQREHLLNYIWDHPGKYKIGTFDPSNPKISRPDLKLDIDTPLDYLKFLKLPLHPAMTDEEIVYIFSLGQT